MLNIERPASDKLPGFLVYGSALDTAINGNTFILFDIVVMPHKLGYPSPAGVTVILI
jgi:hypothetical protein